MPEERLMARICGGGAVVVNGVRSPRARWLLWAALVGVLEPISAEASGFLVARFGGEHGHPTTDNPTAMYYNPAGLSLGSGTRLYLEGVLAYRTASYQRPAAAIDNVVSPGSASGTPDDAVQVNSGKASLSNLLGSPFVGVASDLGVSNLGVGVGFYAPFGGVARWGQNAAFRGDENYPGAVDGVQRWATIDGSMRSLYTTAAVSYRLPEYRLSVGLGVNLVNSDLSTVRARNSDGTDDVVTKGGQLQEGRSVMEARGSSLSAGAGVIFQPTDHSWIGVSYQSQPGFGETALEGTITSKLGGAPVTTQPVEVSQALPDVFRVGGRVRPTERTEFRLFGEYVRWSVFRRQCVLDRNNSDRKCALTESGALDPDNGGSGVILNIPRDWKNAGGLRAGGSFWPVPEVEVYGGLGYDGNAVPDATIDASLFDMDKASVSAGVRVELFDRRLALGAGYTQGIYFTRTVAPRERDANGRQVSLAPPSKSPDGAGTYDQTVGALSVALEYGF